DGHSRRRGCRTRGRRRSGSHPLRPGAPGRARGTVDRTPTRHRRADRTRRDGRAALVFYGGIPCTAHLTKLGRCRTQTRAPSGVSRSLAPTSPDSHVRSGATGVSGGTLGTGRRAPLAARRARGGALVSQFDAVILGAG